MLHTPSPCSLSHLVQGEGHAAGDLPDQLERLGRSDADAVLGGVQAQAALKQYRCVVEAVRLRGCGSTSVRGSP